MKQKNLLILDLDETLIHASNEPLDISCSFEIEDFYVYQRPYLKEFIESVNQSFKIAIWSSGVEYYVLGIIAKLAEDILPLNVGNLEFLWGRSHCTAKASPAQSDGYFLKDLSRVEEAGYSLSSVLIVEDETRKVHKHYDNAIFVSPFRGDTNDGVLKKLSLYLDKIKDIENVTELEKRFWDREV